MGSDGNKTGKITIETVRKAIMGAQIKNNYEMYVYYKGIPQECQDAIEAIRDHYAEFEKLLWDQLSALRLTKKFFGRLIRARLKQRDILASPIVSAIFDDSRRLERRLESIQSIRGVEELRREYRSSSDPARGDETDWLIRDLLAEILTLDFLKQLDFSGIRKVREESNKAHIDVVAQRKGKFYAIEVTRKKEIQGWETLEQPLGHNIGLEDCDDATNQKEICRLLRNALQSKADQFSRALDSGTIDHSMAKVVAIKTSDYGFAECIDQAEQIARELLSDPNAWSPVDCTWLLPNVDALQSRWVYGKTADVVRN